MTKYLQKLDTVGFLLLVAAAIMFTVRNVWDVWTYAMAVAGAVLIVAGLVANYRQIMATLGKRSTKYITNYAVSVVLVIALVAGLNFVGQRHSKRFDLTGIGRFTLARRHADPRQTGSGSRHQGLFPAGLTAVNELLTEFKGDSRHVRYDLSIRTRIRKSPTARRYGVRTFSNRSPDRP